ncbi:MAG: hypothetical protein IPM59_03440 [Chloracidobacterium sp.]|nr:hypothetical protein [Chloracidobacterium sp.]
MASTRLKGITPEELIKIYSDEVRFLIDLKRSVGILNNRIHDKLSLIAIEKLRGRHPGVTFEYGGAGVGGIDIIGRRDDNPVVVAEVKTTDTLGIAKLRGPQKLAIERDLQRLMDAPGNVARYMIVISEQAKQAVEQLIQRQERFSSVEVIDAIGFVNEPSVGMDLL